MHQVVTQLTWIENPYSGTIIGYLGVATPTNIIAEIVRIPHAAREAINGWAHQLVARRVPDVVAGEYMGAPAQAPDHILAKLGYATDLSQEVIAGVAAGKYDLPVLPTPPPTIVSWADGWLHDRDSW